MDESSFTCRLCNNVFRTNNSSEEMEKEFVERYGHPSNETVDDEVVSLCDDCYDKVLKLDGINNA